MVNFTPSHDSPLWDLHAQANNGNGPTFELATIDWVIVGLYVLGILGLGFWIGRGKKSAEDLLLGGRDELPSGRLSVSP